MCFCQHCETLCQVILCIPIITRLAFHSCNAAGPQMAAQSLHLILHSSVTMHAPWLVFPVLEAGQIPYCETTGEVLAGPPKWYHSQGTWPCGFSHKGGPNVVKLCVGIGDPRNDLKVNK